MTAPEFNEAQWFASQVLPHEPMLRAWLHSRFQDLREVDDIVQEAYRRILLLHGKQELGNPKAYLFATARNLALDYFRLRRTQPGGALTENEVLDVLDEGEGIPENLTRRQDLELLTEAIQTLPKRCRQVLTLRKIYGLSQKEIAAQLGIAEHTVEAQVTIGVRKCTAFLLSRREN